MSIIITKISSLSAKYIPLLKEKRCLELWKKFTDGQLKGEVSPCKKERHLGNVCWWLFHLSNWMSLHALEAYRKTWEFFSCLLQCCKVGDCCKCSSLLLSVVSLFQFLNEWLWMQDWGSNFQLSSVLFPVRLPVYFFQGITLMGKSWRFSNKSQLSHIKLKKQKWGKYLKRRLLGLDLYLISERTKLLNPLKQVQLF